MVSMEMAVNEGWYGKNGSKWQSMPDLMLRYRSAAFFGRIYAPELLMGLPGADEVRDTIDLTNDGDGGYSVPEAVRSAAETPKAPVSKSETAAAAATATKADSSVTDLEEKQPAAPVDIAQAATKTVAEKPETAASTADQSTGELPAFINAGQVKYLEAKIKALQLPPEAVTAMLQRIGAESLAVLNIKQFDTVKAELLSLGA